MRIEPKIKGFLCTTAHPAGCAADVDEQIQVVEAQGPIDDAPKRVLVIGASGGYGLASRIVAAMGCGAATMGVFFERPAKGARTASPGWYKTAAFVFFLPNTIRQLKKHIKIITGNFLSVI